MALEPGTRFGSYEVVDAIGAGGMGEVYRATDTKLGRDVAIKTLPSTLANDADRLARFEREAKLLAALNHANIAAIYGLDEYDGLSFIAMELVDGETLEQRLTHGALPLESALQIALQIAEALEAAHAKGVVHRDLKPANVMVTSDGVVKVLDFGLAKAFSGDPNEVTPAHSPALSMAMTQAGLILGTAGYMSPEQASGQATDQRADIWAFGIVLYEMLTGQPAFSGESVPHILADVLRADPNWDHLPKDLHPRVRLLLERCLEKKVRNRYHSIADARVDIEKALSDPQSAEPAAKMVARRPIALPVAAAAVIAAVVGALAVSSLMPAREPELVARFPIMLEESQLFTEDENGVVDISPDGTRIVYAADNRLWIRDLDEMLARPIPGIDTEERPTYPAFSPSGESLLYFSDRDLQLRRVSVDGGTSITLTDSLGDDPQGVYWDPNGTIYYVGVDRHIMGVSANGGIPEVIVEADESEEFHGARSLPGGEWLLFTVTTASGTDRWDQGDIVAQSLTTGERRELWRGGSDARYIPTGHLVYALDDALFVLPFDLENLKVTGGPTPVAAEVQRSFDTVTDSATANYGVSTNGTLVYVPFVGSRGSFNLAWVDHDGEIEPIGAEPRPYYAARISPDGGRAALDVRDDQNDIFIWDFSDETLTRLTFESDLEQAPVWNPDGERVAFRLGNGIVWKASNNTGATTPIVTEQHGEFAQVPVPMDFNQDGSRLIFGHGSPGRGREVAITSVDGSSDPEVLISSQFLESNAVLSPDGRWIAYESDVSGSLEIYVRPFPNVDDGVWQISNTGGDYPLWSPTTNELYYHTGNPRPALIAAEYISDETFVLQSRRELFEFGNRIACCGALRPYDIAPDGERFLMMTYADRESESSARRINVVVNWFEELERLAPTN